MGESWGPAYDYPKICVRERRRFIFQFFKEIHFQIFFFANHLTYDASIQHGYGKSQQKKKMMMTKK